MTRTSALPAGADHRRIAADWGIIGAVAAAVAVLMALGSWIQAARRPARLIESPSAGRRYREDAADEPGPSERVRELVRRDPEVAASVLQRWATQGGRVS
jgi:flagellar biosynthesis/type III secretory pathway M-ring protein FliF/YscJ